MLLCFEFSGGNRVGWLESIKKSIIVIKTRSKDKLCKSVFNCNVKFILYTVETA